MGLSEIMISVLIYGKRVPEDGVNNAERQELLNRRDEVGEPWRWA